MMRLWHNPRCSKSRATLALLEAAGHTPEIYRYLDTPPGADDLTTVLGKLGIGAIDLVRKGEAAWKASGLTPASPEADIRAALLSHPILIERPILECADRAAIGRPPDNVLTIL